MMLASLDTAFRRDTTPTQPNPVAPTHEVMQRRGWVPQQTSVDPVTGRKYTVYANHHALPKPGRDYRPLLSDMEKPNRKLIYLQGNHHSSDPEIHREPVQGHKDRLRPDGTNAQLYLQQHVRAAKHDEVLRITGMRRETPEKEFQTGNKAGFLGVHNLTRIVQYLPPTLRHLIGAQAPVVDTDDLASGTRSTESMLRPTHRPGTEQRQGEASTLHSMGTERAPARDQSDRMAQTREITGQTSGAHPGRTNKQAGPDGLRQDQQTLLPETSRHEMRAAAPIVVNPHDALVRGIPQSVETRPQPMNAGSPSAVARGMFNRLTEVLAWKRAPTESDRPDQMREATEQMQHRERTGGELVSGPQGRATRFDTTKRHEMPHLPLANVKGYDEGVTGGLYLDNAKHGSRVGTSEQPDMPTVYAHVPQFAMPGL